MKFHPFGCASLTTRLLFEQCACVLYIRLSIQWVIWVFFFFVEYSNDFPHAGKFWEIRNGRKILGYTYRLAGVASCVLIKRWGAGWYASRSVRFNQPYINADPWPSSFMYHPTLSQVSTCIFLSFLLIPHLFAECIADTTRSTSSRTAPSSNNRRRLFLLGLFN